MKVLEYGQKPEDKEYIAKCYNCKSKVQFVRKEAKCESGGRNDSYLVIPCPVCQHTIYHEI